MTPEVAIYTAWGLWLLSWLAAARWANASIKTAGFGREITYRLLQLAGFVALFAFRGDSVGEPGSLSFILCEPLWSLPLWAVGSWSLSAWPGLRFAGGRGCIWDVFGRAR
jgi:hypothetical protein